MNNLQLIVCSMIKQAAQAWSGGASNPATAEEPGWAELNAGAHGQSRPAPENKKVEGFSATAPESQDSGVVAEGAMNKNVWLGNRAVIAGTGSGSALTSGVEGVR